jgi:hypothetical protein
MYIYEWKANFKPNNTDEPLIIKQLDYCTNDGNFLFTILSLLFNFYKLRLKSFKTATKRF